MFLRATTRKKDGKEHRYFSIVENKRVSGGRVVQRHVLYLGEINSSQELAWRRSIEVLDEGTRAPRTLALFPEDRCEALVGEDAVVRLRLAQLRLERPRQWGACWLALRLWQALELDRFWGMRLPPTRKGTRFDQVLAVLVVYRLLAPGSEWRLHRHWFDHSALADLLGVDHAAADIHTLYACHDRLLAHKQALFDHLVNRWRDLFNARFDVLLYDLTSTYFESDPPADEQDKRRHGYSRDHRPDCVQVVIALVVTPEGFPLAYEVLAGNTADSTTLKDFLARIEGQYGKARRVWCMDRGVPTEEVLAQMRAADPPVQYLVGTPKGRLTRLEQALLERPWHQARPEVKVKLLPQDDELYVFAESRDRVAKERSMRRRQMKWLWARLQKLSIMELTRDQLLMKSARRRAKRPRRGGSSSSPLPKAPAPSAIGLTATSSNRRGAGKAAICCAPISPRPIRRSSGSSICSWSKWKRRSRRSKAIWRSAPCSIRPSQGSRRISSSPSSPTACMSRSASN